MATEPLSEAKKERWLELVAKGLDRKEASYAVDEMPGVFNLLAIDDREFRKRMIVALEEARKERLKKDGGPINPEVQEHFLHLIRNGYNRHEAAVELGLTATKFRALARRSEEFNEQYEEAIWDGKSVYLERLRAEALRQALNGEYRALKDQLLVHDPEFAPLLTKRVEIGNIDGESLKVAAIQSVNQSSLSLEEMDTLIALLEKAQAPPEPPPPLQLVQGDTP